MKEMETENKGMEKIEYEVHSDYAAAQFKNEDDAVNALWMLGFYHGFELDKDMVRKKLDKECFYECFPLSIIKTVY